MAAMNLQPGYPCWLQDEVGLSTTLSGALWAEPVPDFTRPVPNPE